VVGVIVLASVPPRKKMNLRIERRVIFEGYDPAGTKTLADIWLTKSAELGLGTHDADHMELTEITLA
jgi:hypothetical protein